jgi:hypothetical protein
MVISSKPTSGQLPEPASGAGTAEGEFVSREAYCGAARWTLGICFLFHPDHGTGRRLTHEPSSTYYTGGPAGAPNAFDFGVFWLGSCRNKVISCSRRSRVALRTIFFLIASCTW